MNLKKFVFLALLDQITKLLAFRGFFDFCQCINPAKNYGLIFSLDFGVYSLVISLLFFIFFFWYLIKSGMTSRLSKTYFLLILAGSISNMLDRLLLGYVRDFINLGAFTINVADLYLFSGILLVLLDSES